VEFGSIEELTQLFEAGGRNKKLKRFQVLVLVMEE